MAGSLPPADPTQVTRVEPLGPGGGDGALTLLVSSAAGAWTVPLPDKANVTIGRTSEADVVIDDPSISRRHAILHLGSEPCIEDLGSTNGTRVGGIRLAPGERHPVAIDTVIELGSATTLLQRVRAKTDPSAPRRTESTKRSMTNADPTMQRLDALVDVIAPTELSVLILGETGVGKEVFAEQVHRRSKRARAPLLKINAAALPESVLEGELFGYEKGAFTGATQARSGLFEAAHGGTVFLDEVGELPLATQAKLLRVFENGEVMRVGARVATKVDVRFIAATNRDLRALIDDGKFRNDLYFRLNGMSVTLPPLRKRTADIVPLARSFLAAAAKRLDREPPELHADAVAFLTECAFPGNVRQLKTVIERTLVFCSEPELRRRHLELAAPELLEGAEPAVSATATATQVNPLQSTVRAAERRRIVEALEQANGNQKRAAEILGVSRRTLINKLELHGVGRPRKGGA